MDPDFSFPQKNEIANIFPRRANANAHSTPVIPSPLVARTPAFSMNVFHPFYPLACLPPLSRQAEQRSCLGLRASRLDWCVRAPLQNGDDA
jgi:hypothetical protein